FNHHLPECDGLAVVHFQTRAVNHVVALFLAALLVDDGDQAGAVHGNENLVAAFDYFQVDELHEAVVLGFDLGLFRNARGRAADVECAHSELRARLTDGLRGDDAHRFAHFDETPGGQVTAVAAPAHTAARLASEHGANLHPLNARRLDSVGQFLGNFLIDLDDDVAFIVFDLLERHAADYAVAQRLDFDAGFENRLDVNSIRGAAIEFIDDDVLRHIDQPTSQVT